MLYETYDIPVKLHCLVLQYPFCSAGSEFAFYAVVAESSVSNNEISAKSSILILGIPAESSILFYSIFTKSSILNLEIPTESSNLTSPSPSGTPLNRVRAGTEWPAQRRNRIARREIVLCLGAMGHWRKTGPRKTPEVGQWRGEDGLRQNLSDTCRQELTGLNQSGWLI
ncbi:MAG: hypothetical protein IJ523_09355 [Succinivibrionaceae bacterium]|nr:hypothetical protein [Succinivibrionaceae bacterium]